MHLFWPFQWSSYHC